MPRDAPKDPHEPRRFSDSLEREFRASIEVIDRKTNFYALLIALPLYALYALLDAITLTNARDGVVTRLAAAAIAAIPLSMMRRNILFRSHDTLTCFSIIVLGLGMNYIILREPTFDDNYYVALIQGGIFVSFLARLSFAQSLTVLITFLAGFIAATVDKSPREDVLLQIFILVTMFGMCAFGIHLTQKLRRKEFLQARTIARQNEKLNEMLADVRLDNARKVAAMNLLVHFVRTPLHQIVGFSDVISQALTDEGREAPQGYLDGVRIIKSASRELSQNVTRLLAYYRLDEKAAAEQELIEVDSLLRDYAENFPDGVLVGAALDKVAIYNRIEIVSAAIAAIVARYAEDGAGANRVEIELKRDGNGARITVTDDGALIAADDFLRMTRPLDKADHYLTANGSSMPMALRTVARAAQLCGGELTHSAPNGKNVFRLSLADYGTKSLEEAAVA